MAFCLPTESTKKFLQALKDGVIKPEELIDKTSEERRTFFKDIVGEIDAKEVNAQLEAKLLLKDQKRGMITWAKQLTGISEPIKRDIISKIEKMDKILNAKDQQTFLEDLASKRLGTDVTFEEAKQITELSKQLSEAKANLNENNRFDYGAKLVALKNYVNELKLKNAKNFDIQDLKQRPLGVIKEKISDIAGMAKGIKASLDDSALFRQGWRTLFTNPQIWAQNAVDSFSNIAKQIGRKVSDNEVMNGIKADIYSRPYARDGTYQRMKLDIGENEEAFPTTVPEKIPLFGRLYKASEVAYTGFLYRMRADIADKIINIAKENGINVNDNFEMQSIGKLVNSLTGRGNLGVAEKIGKQVNTIFFSPKMVKSSIDFLTIHAGDNMSVFARKQAATNLVKVISGIAVIMAISKAVDPKSVELDPRSADFGKIRIKDTRFDISGGMSSLVTLAARLITLSSKSSTTGKVTPLNSGKYGSQTGISVAENFLENKLSPASSVVKDIMKGQDFQGNKLTIAGEAQNLLVPLPVTNIQELMNNPNSAPFLISEIADTLGIVTNTYSKKKKY